MIQARPTIAEPLKPPITYFGGKTSIADQIAGLLPAHEHYIEPFCGSLAVLLAKPPSVMETVSDLDGDLVAFWRVLRERPADLERQCALTPHARAELNTALSGGAVSDLERARRVWVRYTQGRSRGGPHQTWRYIQDPRGRKLSMPRYLGVYTGRIGPAAERLRNVSLENLPALEIIRRYGRHPRCLLYVDPPYLKSTRAWVNGPVYDNEMLTETAHRELLGELLNCRAAVVLSGYTSPLYDDLLSAWSRQEIPAIAGNGADQARTEVVWSNRPFPQQSLFDQKCEATA